MLLVNVTYDVVTPESAEHGEADESGFVMENEPVSFRDLVAMLRGGEASSQPAQGSAREWVTHYDWNHGTRRHIEEGAEESRSVHFSRSNPARKARYWALAFRAAGLTQGA